MSEKVAAIGIVGIVNCTPDSLSDVGRFYMDPERAYDHVQQLFHEGAIAVDIGGEATNPMAGPVDVEEEWGRLQPLLRRLLPTYDNQISIDTRHPEIVERAAEYGRFIINDVTTFRNPTMREVAAKYNLRCIARHIPLDAGDTEDTVQDAHSYFGMDSIKQVADELRLQKELMHRSGIPYNNIILDPGIGIGKRQRTNWELLRLSQTLPGQHLMMGFSKKSFLATDREDGMPTRGIDSKALELSLQTAETPILLAVQNKAQLWLRTHEIPPYVALLNKLVAKAA